MESGLLINITTQSIAISTVGVLGFIIGSLVYSRDIHRIDTLSFFLLTWVFSILALFLGIFESIGTGILSFLLLKILYILTALIPVAVLFFISTLSQDGKIIFTKMKLLMSTAPFFILTVAFLTVPNLLLDLIKNNVSEIKTPMLSFWFLLIVIYFFFYTVVSIVLLYRKYKRSAGIFKSEIKYILFSFLIGVLFILFVDIALPFFGIYEFFWLSIVIGFIILCVVGYLLLKYNSWNLKLASTDLLTSLVSLIFLFELFLSVDISDFIIKAIILVLILFAGLLLVKRVREEIEGREEAEKLVKDLAYINDNLHILDKQKTEFVTNSAHHLRDPLTAINGYTSMILDGSFGETNKETNKAVSRILESSQRLVVIVEDFMNISKIEGGKMNYKFSKFDLKKILDDMMDEISLIAKKTGLKLSFNFEQKQDYYIKADEGKIRQVISNLIDNSIKYTPKGSIEISMNKIKGGKKVLLKISDTGIGMNKETLDKIFHKFSRADEASKFHTGGSGLGLYVAKEIVKKHNGHIWAESDGVGKGSTFCLELDVS